MVGFNQVVISGTIASQMNVMATQSGIPVAHFTLMLERAGKNGPIKLYVPVTAWGTVADAVRSLGYGTDVTILGRLSLGKRKDRQTGAERTELEVIAEMAMAGETTDGNESPSYEPQYPQMQPKQGRYGAHYGRG